MPSRRRQAMLVVCFALAVCLLAGAWWLSTRHRPMGSSSGTSVSCITAQDEKDDHCGRVAADIARRTPLTSAQRTAAEQVYNNVQRAMSVDSRCSSAPNDRCVVPSRRPPATDDADRRRTALERAGFVNSVVRIARPDDPAPSGALLYAVPVAENACLVGYVTSVPGGGGGSFLGGLLPHGRCLDD
ncbi:hypothetical protein AB0A63_11210 [Lentzea sp. NPDC042327]|uniref:hypothetical protein n=1 Tax=Lentzea sp. NPDC042327 TaxID=3154801 RepID=UPI00340AEC27